MIRTLDLRALQQTFQYLSPGWYTNTVTGQLQYWDGSNWYVYSAGEYYPLTIDWIAAWKTVAIAAGETLRISYQYYYQGPAVSVKERCSVGVYGDVSHIYDEKVNKTISRSLPQSVSPLLYSGSLDVVLLSSAQADWNDIEAKVTGGGAELGIRVKDCLSVTPIEINFTNFTITDYLKA